MNIKEKIREVLTQNVSTHSVAAGGAIGMFFGFLPFFGVKTLLSYFTSLLLKVSTPAAIISVTLHDLLLPFLPVILRLEYQIGFWLLSHPHHFAPKIRRSNLKFDFFLHWRDFHWKDFLRAGLPVLLGSVVVGIIFAGLVYGLLYFVMTKRKKRLAHLKALKDAGENQHF